MAQLVDQPTAMPTRKVTAFALSSAGVGLLLAGIEHFTQVPVSSGFASALGLFVPLAFAYFTREEV